MKADGIHLDQKILYAVHAPETFTVSKVKKKLEKDYEGFITQKEAGCWLTMKEWIFVLKCPREGIPSEIIEIVANLDGVNGIKTRIWGMEDIEGFVAAWAPPPIPGDLLDQMKSATEQLQRQGKKSLWIMNKIESVSILE